MEQILAPLIHWYDTATRTISCGAPGQIGSTKHKRDVTCTACLANLRAPQLAPVHAIPALH
jgi:hypothetical protein